MSFEEKRRHPRKEVFIAALLAVDDQGYLSEIWDLSQSGARLGRPKGWLHNAPTGTIKIYFMLDQETVITVLAKVMRVTDQHLGVEFSTGQDSNIQGLLYEARFIEESTR
jgi:hypothetical protein